MASEVYDRSSHLRLAIPFIRYQVREKVRRLRSKPVTVRTAVGAIRGAQISSAQFGYRYTHFLGVPYARPPLGELRFRDPVPAEPFIGTFDATAESRACQRDIFTARFCGQEDCLQLNIYTKQLPSDAARTKRPPPADRAAVPVMVFFHGGAFMFGCNNKELYNPEFLLRKDVILVTVNYRLGAFGFLSVDDPAALAPGNAGLKDQVLALRWIRENIGAFGGDADRVTIFGESAGGCSVHYHLLSPMSRGLFAGAIAMSGSALTSWSVCPLQRLPERLARACGWDGSGGNDQMMRVLRTVRADRLLRAQERLSDRVEKRQYMMFTFGPKVEPYRSAQCFIEADPALLSRRPWSRAVPVIFTACSNEGLLVHKATIKNVKLIENLEERFQDMVPLDLMTTAADGGELAARDDAAVVAVAAEFRRFYFGEASMTLAQLERFEQMMSDKLFLHGIYRAIRLRLEAAQQPAAELDVADGTEADEAAPTWYMRFDVESKILNLTKFMFAGRDSRGACHADDCHFLFKTCIHPTLAESSPEFVAIDRFVNLWTEFARTGNPNGEQTRQLVQWDPVQPGEPLRCLNLSQELTYVEMPELDRMHFWDSLYEKQTANRRQSAAADADNGEYATIPVASL